MAKIFPHRPRKVRQTRAIPSVIAEDRTARRLLIDTERRERERIEGERRERMLARRQARLAGEAELIEIERLAASVFPWSELGPQWAIVNAAVRFPGGRERPLTGIAAYWSALVIFGPAAEVLSGDLPPGAPYVLRLACPLTLEFARVTPLIEFLTRYWAAHEDGFAAQASSFRRTARQYARKQIERRRPEIARLCESGDAKEIDDGWFVVTGEFDRGGGGLTIPPHGKALRITPRWRAARHEEAALEHPRSPRRA